MPFFALFCYSSPPRARVFRAICRIMCMLTPHIRIAAASTLAFNKTDIILTVITCELRLVHTFLAENGILKDHETMLLSHGPKFAYILAVILNRFSQAYVKPASLSCSCP